jgi:type II secretory pathway pseudopilin PulG
MHRRRRIGITLIELLVVVAIIAILAGLLLPAILQARGAGRKAQCESNLKQLAQAVQSFHHRNDRLPVYWGAMNGRVGERFGGWLMHLLPDLDQQTAYDSMSIFGTPSAGTTTTSGGGTRLVENGAWRDAVPEEWIPAVPPSSDYQPAQIGTGTAFNANGTSYTYPIVIPQVGTAGSPARKKQVWVTLGPPIEVPVPPASTTNFEPGRLHADYDTETARLSLPVLVDIEDVSALRSPSSASGGGYDNSPLTNYQINAHVLTKFGPRWIVHSGTASSTWTVSGTAVAGSGTNANPEAGGYFPPPARLNSNGAAGATWGHIISSTTGPVGRTFTHVSDGLSNTLLFAEGMRQCDAKSTFRFAFLPSGPTGTNTNWFHEHGFGILPSLRAGTMVSGTFVTSGTRVPGLDAFGTTFMFQTRPLESECNSARVQALHGPYLMAAMCDGSVRAISSLVSRREPVGAAASGRDRFIAVGQLGDQGARGGNSSRWDGVWDMLMVPNDPPSVIFEGPSTKLNVLSNTGEIGRERGPDDPPL